MKVISFDVGIKNLAYCILDEKTNIHDWGLINITNFDDNVNKLCDVCSNKFKTNKIKKINTAKFTFKINNIKYYTCGVHKEKYHKEIIENKIENNYNNELTNETCQYIFKSGKNKNLLCTGKAKINIYNCNYCSKHKRQIIDIINKEEEIKEIKNKNVKKISTENLMSIMIKKLEEYKDKFINDINICIIEHQPNLNMKMRSISDCLYTFFLINGLYNNKSPLNKVKYVSPSTKLIGASTEQKENIDNSSNKKERYRKIKKTGIDFTISKIKNCNFNSKWLDFLTLNKKKDDLCDAYLLGEYFINVKLNN